MLRWNNLDYLGGKNIILHFNFNPSDVDEFGISSLTFKNGEQLSSCIND